MYPEMSYSYILYSNILYPEMLSRDTEFRVRERERERIREFHRENDIESHRQRVQKGKHINRCVEKRAMRDVEGEIDIYTHPVRGHKL